MVTVKFLQDYGNYRKGSEHQVKDVKTMQTLAAKGIIEVVKAKPETTTAPQGENAMLKPEKVHTRKARK